MLAEALTATYDVNLAVTARAADLVERQALDWVGDFVGFPRAEGAFTSGGMISNLTALLVARERALPGCREDGFAGRRGAVYCSDGVASLGRPGGRGRRHRLGRFVRRLPIDDAAAHARRRARGGDRAPTWTTGSSRSRWSPTAARP